eukprot:TRINITY_DN50752_c0_g1_i1.p1 TRINITY_DN50752_c0_g1~~TRINITY_DN50752_c0_g1_i1.p1  ORF type:complete len:946 (+),score=296.54 TRINITY_DN50752_c0_g1_i1:95-2932(+)
MAVGATSNEPYTVAAVASRVKQLGDPATLKDADRWLQRFRKSPGAWRPLSEMLRAPGAAPPDAQLFASQALRRKVQCGEAAEQLGQQGATGLRQQLMPTLAAFRHGPAAVRTQLCLALAALAAGGDSAGTPPDAAVGQVVAELRGAGAEALGVLIEFLTVLAEETRRADRGADDDEDEAPQPAKATWSRGGSAAAASAAAARPEHPAVGAMRRVSASVLEVLGACADAGAGVAEVMRALARWVFLCDPADLARSRLVPVSVQALASYDGESTPWDEAGECVAELARVSPKSPELAQLLISAVPVLSQAFRSTQVPVHHRGIALGISTIGAAHGAALASASTPDAVQMVSLLADCAQHESIEHVGALTFPAWRSIAAHFSRLPEHQRGSVRQQLEPHIERLTHGLLRGAQEMEGDDEFRRGHLSGACRDCTALAPVRVTEIVVGHLQQAVAKADESQAEAALWFIQAAPSGLRLVPTAPQVVLQVRWPVGGDLPKSCRAAFAAVCGRLSWLLRGEAGEALVTPLLEYIEAALSDKEQGYSPVREAAGSALVDLSFGCPARLASPSAATVLLRAYGSSAPMVGSCSLDDVSGGKWWKGLITAVCAALSNAQAQLAQELAQAAAGYSKQRATEAAARGDGAAVRGELRFASELLLGMPRTNGDADGNVCVPVLSELWECAEGAMRTPQAAPDGCRFAAAAARSSPSALKNALGQVTQALSDGFRAVPTPDHLRAAAAILTAYSKHADCRGPLVEFIASFAQPTLAHLLSKGFAEGVEFASELFLMLTASCTAMREVAIHHAVIPQCIGAACAALTAEDLRESMHQHRAAVTQAARFLEALMADGAGAEAAAQLLQRAGPDIVGSLVKAVAQRDLPTFKHLAAALRLCAARAPHEIEQWLMQGCSLLPNRSQAAQQAMQTFVTSLRTAGHQPELWEKACDIFNRTIEIV